MTSQQKLGTILRNKVEETLDFEIKINLLHRFKIILKQNECHLGCEILSNVLLLDELKITLRHAGEN